MRELNLPMPEPPAPDQPDQGAARDPFGIVGTTQAETFLIEKVVAHGGFGVIYRAQHKLFRAPVAIKCLKIPETLTPAERMKFFERFRGEGEVMFRLSSSIPEIVRPMHVDVLSLPDGRVVPFIALEWLEGETLKDVIVRRLKERRAPLALEKLVGLLTPVAAALTLAHRFPGAEGPLAILHCDLKPDNIFVAKTNAGQQLKIFDFGIAKVRSAATREAGGTTRVDGTANMFTPAYAAPEQWAPDKFGQAGPWTDVFAFALTLTELSTQRPAIDGPPAAMLSQCLDERKRPTPRRLGLTISDELDDTFTRALAVDPKQRTQSVEQFWRELEDALGLAPSLGGAGRRSRPAISAALPPSWDDDDSGHGAVLGPRMADIPEGRGPTGHEFTGGLDFAGELELAAPRAPASRPPQSLGELDGIGASPASAPAAHAPAAHEAFPQIEAAGGPLASLDLADVVPRKAPAPKPPAATPSEGAAFGAPLSQPGGAPPPVPSQPGPDGQPGAPPPDAPAPSGQAKEKLQAAAAQAGVVAAQTAQAAKSLAKLMVKVDQEPIRLDDPATWVRPMRGPLIAIGAAILITLVAVMMNSSTGSNFPVGYVSTPLLLAAFGFLAYRWIKIPKV